MKDTAFGKTGLTLSKLGYGCMRFPYADGKLDKREAVRLMNVAFDNGVNYFDTAPFYCDYESEVAVGEFIRDKRDKIILSTKNMGRTPAEFTKSFDDSFRRLKADYVDVFHAWSMSLADFRRVSANGTLDLLFKAKKEGKIRHAAFSFHDGECSNVKEVIDSGLFESMLLSFNMLKRANLPWLEYAHSKGLGTVVMNPVAGGVLSSRAALALKYVWSHPYIDVALSGMGSEAQVLENCRTASDGFEFTSEEKNRLNETVKEHVAVLDLYCTACGYCKGCSESIAVTEIFTMYNDAVLSGEWESARKKYAVLNKDASDCVKCGECLKKCPQKLDIVELLKKVHNILIPNCWYI